MQTKLNWRRRPAMGTASVALAVAIASAGLATDAHAAAYGLSVMQVTDVQLTDDNDLFNSQFANHFEFQTTASVGGIAGTVKVGPTPSLTVNAGSILACGTNPNDCSDVPQQKFGAVTAGPNDYTAQGKGATYGRADAVVFDGRINNDNSVPGPVGAAVAGGKWSQIAESSLNFPPGSLLAQSGETQQLWEFSQALPKDLVLTLRGTIDWTLIADSSDEGAMSVTASQSFGVLLERCITLACGTVLSTGGASATLNAQSPVENASDPFATTLITNTPDTFTQTGSTDFVLALTVPETGFYQYRIVSLSSVSATAVDVPEPGTLAMLGIGLLGVAYRARRKSKVVTADV